MSNLIINAGGLISNALKARFEAHGDEVSALPLPMDESGLDALRTHFEMFAAAGGRYANIYIDLTEGFDEAKDFETDPAAAMVALERRLKETLKALKYGANHMARGDGGRIWVMCYDHSVSFSVSAPSNPITNYAVMAAMKCVSREVAHFDVSLNLFMIHPPGEIADAREWKQARSNLNVYRLKYKPQSAGQVSEVLYMYARLEQFTTNAGVIPVGCGVSVCNY